MVMMRRYVMQTYKIHPIVMGTKVFDKGMMTYQHDPGFAAVREIPAASP
jgi:hypothetical protein